MTTTADIAGVILCGGRSSRMGGGDKSLQRIGGKPMLARIIDRLQPQLDRLALNANGDPTRFKLYGLPVLSDSLPDFPGPLAGILAGMEWASALPGVSHLVSVAGDTPFFPRDLVKRLVAVSAPRNITVASSAGRRHPVFALWPIGLRDDLALFLGSGNSKVSAFIDRHDPIDVEFPLATTGGASFDPFFNINTPGDLEEAHRILELGE
jgi:molybdenum cofactor guanylyltransferase